MPFDADLAASTTERVTAQFAELGTAMPLLKRRGAAVVVAARAAWEFHWSSHLLRIAEARRGRAITTAVKAGVLFDHLVTPERVGTTRMVYQGELVQVAVSVAAPVLSVDHAGFVADLLAAGVERRLVNRLTKRHTREAKAAHKFVSYLTVPA